MMPMMKVGDGMMPIALEDLHDIYSNLLDGNWWTAFRKLIHVADDFLNPRTGKATLTKWTSELGDKVDDIACKLEAWTNPDKFGAGTLRATADQPGIDPATIITLVTIVLQMIQAFRNRRKPAPVPPTPTLTEMTLPVIPKLTESVVPPADPPCPPCPVEDEDCADETAEEPVVTVEPPKNPPTTKKKK